MKKRLRLYLETTVPNYIFADDAPEKQEITLRFWDEVKVGQYEVFISEVVLGEIEKTKDLSKREKLLKVIEGIPFLDLTEECRNLARVFIEKEIIPSDYEPDALHIAIGIIHQVDAIVSWNLKHIVNIETKLAARKITREYGYKDMEICTPEEVIIYD